MGDRTLTAGQGITLDEGTPGVLGIAAAVPAGLIAMYGGPTAPSGWLLCDGAAVSRTTYAALFAAIGTTWGSGDWSTTFNVPDLQGRAAIGVGSGSGLTTRALADKVGAETHQLTEAELAAHQHAAGGDHDHGGSTDNEGAHTHGVGTELANCEGYSQSAPTLAQASDGGSGSMTSGGGTDHAHSIPGSGDHQHAAAGSDTAHNNMQPSLAVNFIIKT